MKDEKPNIEKLTAELMETTSLDQLRYGGPNYVRSETSERAKQNMAKYAALVHGEKPKGADDILRLRQDQEMAYSDARRKFYRILQMAEARIEILENKPGFKFIIDDHFKNILVNLVKYLINDPGCEWPLHRGLFFYGPTGNGKTILMESAEQFTRENNLSKRFEFASLTSIYDEARDHKVNVVERYRQFNRAFDEFGRKTGTVNIMGNHVDINEALIEERYNRFRRYGQYTHFVSNMTPNEATPLFTEMVMDRLGAMCNSVQFIGESKR